MCEAVNAVGSEKLTQAEVKKLWSDIKVELKRRLAAHRQSVAKRGGGTGEEGLFKQRLLSQGWWEHMWVTLVGVDEAPPASTDRLSSPEKIYLKPSCSVAGRRRSCIRPRKLTQIWLLSEQGWRTAGSALHG